MRAEDDVFRALADPTRRAVFAQVCRGSTTVKSLTERFDVSQPAISQHLAALKRCGLVVDRKQGRFVHYRVRPAGLRPLLHWIDHCRSFWLEHLPRLGALLEDME
jgi:DNA-binding transcriptional ArsR family regulator